MAIIAEYGQIQGKPMQVKRDKQTMSNLPSIRTIETRLSVTRETAKSIRRAMESTDSRRVYHVMQEIDSLLGTHGIEYLTDSRDGMHQTFGIDYCNTGDTYGMTVMLDWSRCQWLIGSWGDLVEQTPGRFE